MGSTTGKIFMALIMVAFFIGLVGTWWNRPVSPDQTLTGIPSTEPADVPTGDTTPGNPEPQHASIDKPGASAPLVSEPAPTVSTNSFIPTMPMPLTIPSTPELWPSPLQDKSQSIDVASSTQTQPPALPRLVEPKEPTQPQSVAPQSVQSSPTLTVRPPAQASIPAIVPQPAPAPQLTAQPPVQSSPTVVVRPPTPAPAPAIVQRPATPPQAVTPPAYVPPPQIATRPPVPAASAKVERVVWSIPGWSQMTNVLAQLPFRDICDVLLFRDAPLNTDKLYAGVAIGPIARDRNDRAYADFKDKTQASFRKMAPSQARIHQIFVTINNTTNTKTTTNAYDRYTVSYDPYRELTVLIGVENGRCVAYWFIGKNAQYFTFLSSVGNATIQPHYPNQRSDLLAQSVTPQPSPQVATHPPIPSTIPQTPQVTRSTQVVVRSSSVQTSSRVVVRQPPRVIVRQPPRVTYTPPRVTVRTSSVRVQQR